MSDEPNEQPLISRKGLIFDGVLSLVFFIVMSSVLKPHVPSDDESVIMVVASMTSCCMTGVFWLAVNMFRVTLVDFQRTKKKD
jgi:hypothetical protein